MQKRVTIYGAGGCGVNMVAKVVKVPNNAVGYAEVNYVAIDASRSNIVESDIENTYLIPGVDGSGSNRKDAYGMCEPHVDKILRTHPPTDFNIVVFSLGGGVGSTMGPLILNELLSRGLDVVIVVVGSIVSERECSNTINTLNSMLAQSQMQQRPIVMNFYLNDESTRRTVDAQVENAICVLALLMSGVNEGLDSKDLSNWANYTNVVQGIEPTLVDLIIGDDKMDMSLPAITTASLLPGHDTKPLSISQGYDCYGYLPSVVVESNTKELDSIHFIVTNAKMEQRMNVLKEALKVHTEHVESMRSIKPVEVDVSNANASGMIF